MDTSNEKKIDSGGASACEKFRLSFDMVAEGDLLDAESMKLHETHPAQCSSCLAWKAQTEQILELAAGLPQFDVPEALTQKILSQLEAEKRNVVSLDSLPSLPLGVMGMFLLLLVLPFENLQGLLSWSIGFAGLGLFNLLVSSASASEQTN